MLRVGFLYQGSDAWLAGVNYLWNLLFAIGAHERDELAPVLLAPESAPLHGLDRLDGVEIVRIPSRAEGLGAIATRTLARRAFGVDPEVAALARRHRLDALSHSGTFGWRFPTPTLPWLPDLQHRRLPGNFSAAERARRIYFDVSQLVEGSIAIVSSHAAQADCRRYYGPLARHTVVLPFVSQPRVAPDRLLALGALRERYVIPARYFILPNQFWRHKNHAVVVDALAIAARRGARLVVVLTGEGEDYRAPRHYAELMARVRDRGVAAQFVHLGTVPFDDLAALMKHSVAVINPSLFEGWSTTVEEARSLGKAALLSDIDVHREQDPPGARYFPPHDADELARAMESLWSRDPTGEDAERERAAAVALPGRTAAFAARYRELVVRAIAVRTRRA